MKLRCPACHAEFPLEAALSADHARSAFLAVLRLLGPLGSGLAQYLSLFRPAKRALSFERIEKLVTELQPMLESKTVTRKGVTYAAPTPVWQQAFAQLIELRDQGKLELPLTNHNFLVAVIAGIAAKAANQAELKHEQQLRSGSVRTNHSQDEQAVRKLALKSRVKLRLDLGEITREQHDQFCRDIDAGREVKGV